MYDFHHTRRLLQVHWLPILFELRGKPRRPNAAGNVALPQFGDFIKRWEKLGEVYSLSTRSREFDRDLTSYVLLQQKLQGCFWEECPCYGRKPQHDVRRVCKGCWRAYYCGPRCQAR